MIAWFLACSGPDAPPAAVADPTVQTADSGPVDPWSRGLVGDPERGEPSFALRCATCHGPGGRGGLGPDLAPLVPMRTDVELWETITNGVGSMPPVRLDSDQEAVDLVAWLRVEFP
jgi:mono/diheme cytochrome c family protein